MSASAADSDHTAKVTRVLCTYTTVFDSKVSRYYAVAPTNPYHKLLSTPLRADAERIIAENGGGGCVLRCWSGSRWYWRSSPQRL
ncbi:hypothetical_protein [Leishmania major strain Friedlin]|nr:hypothetical_protein [Leishmania major strain Friedlin]